MNSTKQTFWQKWNILIILGIATFVLVVDATMMNVSISALVKDLNTNLRSIQTAITIYSLVMAAFMITGSKLGEVIGQKRAFLLGVIIYGAGTLMASLSCNVNMLISGWSILEGIGAAIMLPTSMTLLINNYRGDNRAIGLGLLGGIGAAGTAIGPILGGAFTTYASWRWAFGMELIFILIILLFSHVIKKSDIPKKIKLDYLGSILSIIGLGLIVMAIIGASTYGIWEPKDVLVLGGKSITPFGLSIIPFVMLFGVIILIFFAWWENKLSKQNGDPLIRINIFSNTKFISGLGVVILEMIILSGILFIVPVFLQKILDYNAIETGIALLPMSITILLFSILAPRFSRKILPKYLVFLGITLMILGIFLFKNKISTTMTDSDMLLGFTLFGIGAGLIIALVTNLTLSSVNSNQNSEASGIFNTVKSLGMSLGTAILGSALIFFTIGNLDTKINNNTTLDEPTKQAITLSMSTDLQNIPDKQTQKLAASMSEQDKQKYKNIIIESVTESMQKTLQMVMILGVFCLLAATFLPKKINEN